MAYRQEPHTADLKFVLEARDLAALFRDATAVIRELVAGQSPVAMIAAADVTLAADGPAELLLAYLRELLYRFERDGFVPGDAAFTRAAPTALVASVRGERFDPARHETQPEVKAVTRHGLVVEERGGGWHAEVVFDM